jgi:predicted tellurium resistance membrane protein TerC
VSEAAMTADEFRRKLRAKNLAVGLAVAAVMVLFFIITIVRFGGH